MTERLIDAVCPHCGRVGTTVRVVLHEDGYTKLSRRCTDCGGECIHTFDHDWLADAKNKKLQTDNEHLTNAVALVSERVRQLSEERDYAWGEVEKQRAEIERLFNEDTKTRHALKGWVFVCPDGGDEPTHERVAAVVAEVDRLRADLATQQGCCDGAAAQDAHVRQEREEHRAEVELLRDDAMRYRWLRKQKALRLVSDGAIWKRENGENFRASHALSANDTRYGVYETLDETIDQAMRGESP